MILKKKLILKKRRQQQQQHCAHIDIDHFFFFFLNRTILPSGTSQKKTIDCFCHRYLYIRIFFFGSVSNLISNLDIFFKKNKYSTLLKHSGATFNNQFNTRYKKKQHQQKI